MGKKFKLPPVDPSLYQGTTQSTDNLLVVDPNLINQETSNEQQLDINKYQPYLKTVFLNEGLDEARAQAQTGWDLTKGALGQAASEVVLGTLEGADYLLHLDQVVKQAIGDNEAYQSWFGDKIKALKKDVEEAVPIYQTREAQSSFAPGDATWWASNAPSIASSLSLLIPAAGATRLVGAGAKATRAALGFGALSQEASKVAKGLTMATFSRAMENTMESNQTYESTYQKAISLGYGEEEAKQKAGEAAANTWQANSALWFIDAMQFSSLMNAFGKTAAKEGAKMTMGEFFKQMGSEGLEEIYQSISSKESQYQALNPESGSSKFGSRLLDYLQDPDTLTAGFFGALGGGVFAAGGTQAADAVALGIDKGLNKLGVKEPIFKVTAKQAILNDLAKARDLYFGDTVGADQKDDITFAQLAYNHVQAGQEEKLKETLEELKKDPNIDDTARQNLSKRIEDVDFLAKEVRDLREKDFDPEVKMSIVNSKIAHRFASRNLQNSETSLENEYQTLIKNNQLKVELEPLKKLQIQASVWKQAQEKFPESKQVAEKAAETLAAYKALYSQMKQSNPKLTLPSVNDDTLIDKTLQTIALQNEKDSLEKVLELFATPEGRAKIKEDTAKAAEIKVAQSTASKPDVTEKEITEQLEKITSPEAKQVLESKLAEIKQANVQKNIEEVQKKVEEENTWQAPQAQRVFEREAELQTKIDQIEKIPGKKDKKLLNSLKAELKKLTPLANTFRKNREEQVAQLATEIAPDTYEEELKAYEDSKIGLEDHAVYLQSMFVRFFKALQTKSNEELYSLLEVTKSLIKDNERAFNQLTYDRLKGLEDIDENDVDTVKIIKNFNTKKLQAIEEEILKRELETNKQPFILEENTETGKYFIRQKQIEEAFKNNSVEDISEDGKVFTIRGKQYLNLYSDPLQAINRNADGDIVSVTLTNELNRSVTFTTERIVDEVAFGIISQQVLKQAENTVTDTTLTQEVIDQQNKVEKERKEKELVADLLEVQETIDLINNELIDTKDEFVKAGFKVTEVREWLKTTDKYKQLQELKEIEKTIQNQLKQLNKVVPPTKVKQVKQKIQKNEPTTDTTTTTPKVTEGVAEQNNQRETQVTGETTQEVIPAPVNAGSALLQKGAKTANVKLQPVTTKVEQETFTAPIVTSIPVQTVNVKPEEGNLQTWNRALKTELDENNKTKFDEQGNAIYVRDVDGYTEEGEFYLNGKKQKASEVLQTDDNGNLLLDTPLVKIGDTVILRIENNGFRSNPNFVPKQVGIDDIINVYLADKDGNQVGDKPISQLTSADNPALNKKQEKFNKDLRKQILDNGGTLTTTIVHKTIGDTKTGNKSNPIAVLEWDYYNDQFTKLPFNPLLLISGQIPNLDYKVYPENYVKLVNQAVDLTKTRPEESMGGIAITRMSADGTHRLEYLENRNLNEQEIDHVLTELANFKDFKPETLGALKDVVLITPKGGGSLSLDKNIPLLSEKLPGLGVITGDNKLLVKVSSDEVFTISNFAFKNLMSGKSGVDIKTYKLVDGKGVSEKITLTGDQYQTYKDHITKSLQKSFRNVSKAKVNTLDNYTDPVTKQVYKDYWDFLNQTRTLTTRLRGSLTGGSGIESSYSSQNAQIYLDPYPNSQTKVEVKGDEIQVVSQPPLTLTPTSPVGTKKADAIKERFAKRRQGKNKPASGYNFKVTGEKELQWFKDNYGEEFLDVVGSVDRFIGANGVEAFGMYYNALVTLAQESPSGTVFHEAGHFVMDVKNGLITQARKDKILNEASKVYGIKRSFDKSSSRPLFKAVDYQLKAVDILKSPKADEIFRKGDKNNWTIEKIMQELAIPKEQQELIKSFNTRNREEILTSLLANYSYAVEINTALDK